MIDYLSTPLHFNNIEVKRVTDHKHLGLTLDSKLSFVKHITDKIGNARKGIGNIKHLSTYLPLKTRDQVFKMHIRPHLDYCDMIYHVPVKTREMSNFDCSRTLQYLMKLLESTQYQAALAVSGAWKGTSREKIYDELGWESPDHRRTFRRLTQFYKIMKGLTPGYLKIPALSLRSHLFGLSNDLKNIPSKTQRYRNSFFPDTVSLWNDLGPKLRGSESLAVFKRNLLKLYRLPKKSLFNIYDDGTKWIFQLRVGLSPLRSHKRAHKFEDTPSAICNCRLKTAETTCQFLINCPIFVNPRKVLFVTINPILLKYTTRFVEDNSLVILLLYGDEKFKLEDNQNILKATIQFIRDSARFSQM